MVSFDAHGANVDQISDLVVSVTWIKMVLSKILTCIPRSLDLNDKYSESRV